MPTPQRCSQTSGLTLAPDTMLNRLSLAERQMVEIAKALRQDASVLVMDEPTSALTAREVDQLFGLIGRLTARGVAIVYITHRLDEVYRIGQRVTVLRDGRHVATQELAGTTVDQLVRLMANRDIGEHYPRKKGSGLFHLSADESQKGEIDPTPFLLRAERISRDGCGRRMSAFRCDPARSSGSPGCSAPAEPSWRASSPGPTALTPGGSKSTARPSFSGARTTRSGPASACCRRIARRKVSCRA